MLALKFYIEVCTEPPNFGDVIASWVVNFSIAALQIISMKDEHCWVGELNGLRGWFPAKFVELLDERSKNYSLAGDDGVSEAITDLVRGT